MCVYTRIISYMKEKDESMLIVPAASTCCESAGLDGRRQHGGSSRSLLDFTISEMNAKSSKVRNIRSNRRFFNTDAGFPQPRPVSSLQLTFRQSPLRFTSTDKRSCLPTNQQTKQTNIAVKDRAKVFTIVVSPIQVKKFKKGSK